MCRRSPRAAIPGSTPSPGTASWRQPIRRPAIVNKLNAEIVAALKDLETRTLLEQQAMQIIGSSPETFAGFIKQDIAIWKQVADQAKVEVR
jgi:tripartite-type tricarboxylate transporter receptor subunit TctC